MARLELTCPRPSKRPRRRSTAGGGWARAWLALLLACSVTLGGCKRDSEEDSASEGSAASDTVPSSGELPALDLRRETRGVLLTWVDETGDFHVSQSVDDVPEAGRAQVRVVVEGKPEGTGRLVYVADLRHARADGTFAVRTLTRAQWEELGASKRKARLEALAPSARPAEAQPGAPQGSPSAPAHGSRVTAIIYGADWCNPCHQAEEFLKQLGVAVTKKDIEKVPAARAEMQTKLAKIGRGGAAIPVVDVMGRIQVGFSAVALRQAVEEARGGQVL